MAYAKAVPLSMATIEPLVRRSMSPLNGWYSLKRCAMMASPAEAVRTLVRRPMIPLEGMLNSMFTRSACASIDSISPLRRVTISMILLEKSVGTLIVSSSIGSWCTPSISLYITCGCPTCSSYPSRRIVSMSTDKCSTPRPYTVHASSSGSFFTLSARFLSSSLSRRSCM